MLLTPNSTSANRQARRGAILGIVTCAALAAIKLTGGMLGESAALVADGWDALADISTSVAVLVGLVIAGRPADKGHPYGHGKAEAIVAKMVGLALLVVAGQLLWHNGAKLMSHEKLVVPKPWVLAVAAICMTISGWLTIVVWRMGKRTGSKSLLADAKHTAAHTVATAAVLIGVAIAVIGGPRLAFLDPLTAMAVALLIAYTGIEVLRDSWRQIMDAPVAKALRTQVLREAINVPGVLGTEACHCRHSGMDVLVDIHVEVDPHISVLAGHAIASAARDHLMNNFPQIQHVLVHIEPYFPGDHAEED